MIFKHPNKICLNCSGEIYGIIYQCERCDQHTACIRCVNNGTALCFTHGKDFLKSEIIPMPSNVVVSQLNYFISVKLLMTDDNLKYSKLFIYFF